MKRRFEFQEGNSSKFWEVEIKGSSVTTWWGKLGTAGQSKTKEFDSPEKARKEHDKLVAEKTDKGYEEVFGKKASSTKQTTKTTAAKKSLPAKRSAKKAAYEEDEEDEEPEDENTKVERRFEIQDGKSGKFWEVLFCETMVFMTWGKIGSDDQSKRKRLNFASEAEAKRQCDKLIVEKTKEGYTECHASGSDAKSGAKGKGGRTAEEKPVSASAKKSANQQQDYEDKDQFEDGETCSSGARRFELDDGKSSKFWEISLDGDTLTTTWGKIGTDGQSKTLDFDSESDARKQYDKLISEKTKKGYEEVEANNDGEEGDIEEVLKDVSKNCLNGQPVPTDLRLIWEAKLSGDQEWLDYTEVVLHTDISEEVDNFISSGDSKTAKQFKKAIERICFFANGFNQTLLGYWMSPKVSSIEHAPIVELDTEGEFSLVTSSFAEYILFKILDCEREEDGSDFEQAREWLAELGIEVEIDSIDDVYEKMRKLEKVLKWKDAGPETAFATAKSSRKG